jgi:hypothetical protein
MSIQKMCEAQAKMHARYIVINGHIKLALVFQILVVMHSFQYIKQNQSNFDSSFLSPHNLCNFIFSFRIFIFIQNP